MLYLPLSLWSVLPVLLLPVLLFWGVLLLLEPYFLPLPFYLRLIVFDAPGFFSFPVTIVLPALPVLLKPLIRYLFIVPPMSLPVAVFIINPPTWVYVEIETGNASIINPAPVIIE